MDLAPLLSDDPCEPAPSGAAPGIDVDAFRALFERMKEPLFRFLRRLCRDPDDAEDLVQDTFAVLWVKRGQYRGEGSLDGYLRRIAYRTFLNERKRTARERAQPSLDHDPDGREPMPDEEMAECDDREQRRRRLRGVVDSLPDAWREPFVLFRFEGLSCAEVGDVLGLSPKAVEGRLARALVVVAARYREAEVSAARAIPGAR